jgi:hypothetical protein
MIIKLEDDIFRENLNIYLSKIYLLKIELIEKGYNKIIDNNNNFIYFKSIKDKIIQVDSLLNLLL